MKICLISPFSSKLDGEKVNAKNYPYWKELIDYLINDGYIVVQVSSYGEVKVHDSVIYCCNLTFEEIRDLLEISDFWISVDNFLQHLNNFYLKKRGCVIWGKSDFKLFGYKYNLNILKSNKYLRKEQNLWWMGEPYDVDVFLPANNIYILMKDKIKNFK